MRADHEEPTIPARRDPLVGTLLDGRFRIASCLAAGGFGGIYGAIDMRAGGEVALKVLHGALTKDPACVRRFRREGALLLALRDPHTLAAYELGELADGGLYIVMELLRGETIYDRLRDRGPLPWGSVVEIARAVCGSLAEAHARGVVHRDLKPANIFLEQRGNADFVKVLDFGIAKILRADYDHTALTVVGQVIGTVEYMSPEQVQGEPCTARSDIYSLGVIMYELLTGARPFPSTQPLALLSQMVSGPPPSPQAPTPIPRELANVVMHCLAFVPNERYTAIALAAALERLSADDDDIATVHRRNDADEAPTRFTPRAPPPIVQPPPVMQPPFVQPPFVQAPFEQPLRSSQAPFDQRPSQPPFEQPLRPSQAPFEPPLRPSRLAIRYELATVTERDAWVRRAVWAIVIVVCIVIAIIATR